MKMYVQNVRSALAFTGLVASVNVVAVAVLVGAAFGLQALVGGLA